MKKDLVSMKRTVIDVVATKARDAVLTGELDIPQDYSISNALRSAWLELENTTTKNGQPVLTACTRNSIIHALQQMLVQALDPGKSQVYFIAYGNELVAIRSYFGSMALAKRGNPRISSFAAQVVYEGDDLEYDIINGRYCVTKHIQKFSNIDRTKIVAAYANAIGMAGEIIDSELMVIDDIKQAWKMSKTKPVNNDGVIAPGSAHGKFTSEFAKKTVINRLCKRIINTSTDESMLMLKKNNLNMTRMDVEQEADENANKEEITISKDNEAVEERERQNDTKNTEEDDFPVFVEVVDDQTQPDDTIDSSADEQDLLPEF